MSSIHPKDLPKQEIERLKRIMQILRDPVAGCSWDKQQNFKSLLPYLLEECYEVIAAVELDDYPNLQEELGDLLFHIIFYSQLAQEQQLFNFDEVCRGVNEKMLRRHPHLFSDSKQPHLSWQSLKQQELSNKAPITLFDRIPHTFTALMYAQAVQQRCSEVGFDWADLPPVVAKVEEELEEVKQELNAVHPNTARIAEELGDLMFAVVNLVRHAQLDSEQLLRAATDKFKRRFLQVEHNIKQNNRTLAQASLAELEQQWQNVKNSEEL